MKSALLSLFLSAAFAASAADTPPIPIVPDAFLSTDNTAWKRILAKPVKAHFRQALLREALQYLFRDTNANYILQHNVPRDAAIPGTPATPDVTHQQPVLSCNIPEVPLRTALFIIAKESGATVTWHMQGGFPHSIKVSYK